MFSLFFLFIIAVLLYFKYFTKNNNYWTKKGIIQVDGVLTKFIKEKRALALIYQEIYENHPEHPHVGIYLAKPALLLRDLRDIEAVLENDFHNFHHRGIVRNSKELLADNILFMSDYKRWKLIKQKLSPIFTIAKMKNMFYHVEKRIHDFIDNIEKNQDIKKNSFKGLFGYASSLLGASVFGLDDVSDKFYGSPITEMLWGINDASLRNNLIFYISNSFPKFFKLFSVKHFNGYNDYFLNIVKGAIENRRNQTIIRPDLISITLELQKLGLMKDTTTGYEMELTDEVLTAQAFLFYFGGVDNVAIATHFTLLELANNKSILERLQKEVDNIFKECNGKITYDDLGKFEYLDMVISEVFRKYSPVFAIQRVCTNDTIMPSTQKKISKDTIIIIPVYALHRDKKYYPDPEKFDPERFNSENREKIVKFSYIPFGGGNRKCFGTRFSRPLVKFSLAWLLHCFTVKEQQYITKAFDPSFISLRDTSANFELIRRK